MNKSVSPSRTYVAMCSKSDFSGYYFRKFSLPMYLPAFEGDTSTRLENNDSDTAAWYFLNRLDFSACIDGCIAWEDFQKVEDQDELNAKHRSQSEDYSRRLKEAKARCAPGCNHRNPGCEMNKVSWVKE